jgi:F-type H+-transporting ATPase subunit delta
MKTAGSKRIAERYVRALFDVAGEGLNDVEKDLNILGQALAANDEMRHLLNNPLLSREQQAQAMLAVLDKMKAQKVTKQFIVVLAQHKRLAILPDIIALFGQWARQARGEMTAELIAPTPLNVRVVDMVSSRLSKVYGRKVIMEMRQDPALLGGVIVKIGSLQLDSSLAGKMRRLRNMLRAA